MTKQVLAVGNCDADHRSISHLIERNFDAQVVQAHNKEDALSDLHNGSIDLVLVNRKLDGDYSDGLDVIKQIKQDATLTEVPCMMITNFIEHQELAIQAGALLGFGKRELSNPETIARLKAILD